MNCWEYMKCGRERGGQNVPEQGICPAYPDHGQNCAHVVGTFCDSQVQGTFVQKLSSCTQCAFYKSEHYQTVDLLDTPSG